MKPSTKRWALYAILLFASIVSLGLDKSITDAISNKVLALNYIFGAFSNPILLSILFAGFAFLFWRSNDLRSLKSYALAFLYGTIASHILKLIVQRPRPIEKFLPILGWPDYSLPSSHAVVAFAILPVMIKAYPKQKWLLIVIACMIALSRAYLGLHYLSDILLGALIGLGISAFIMRKQYK